VYSAVGLASGPRAIPEEDSVLRNDILRTYNMFPGGRLSKIVGCWRSPGVHAVVVLRFGQWLLRRNWLVRLFLTPVYALEFHRVRRWGIEIPRRTQVGEGFYIGHPGGIEISPAARIGKNVDISQQVTIGASGQGESRGCPTIGDNVYIAPGAKVFGKITIGNNVRIGANAVVHKDIPDNSVVVLAPGFTILPLASGQSAANGEGTPLGATVPEGH
jgi:serine O-acetyltransferase